MEDVFSNVSFTPLVQRCHSGLASKVVLSLIDIIPFLVGQPLITKLLWVIFTSKKPADILNCNLALFHSLHYLISVVHLVVLFSLPHVQFAVLKFLFVYVEIGGPMSLSCICVERYVAVVHPMSYPLLRKYRFREVCAAAVWLASVPIALASVVAADALSSYKVRFIDTVQILVLVVMTVMTVRCSSSVARTLKRSGPGTNKLHPAKRRAFKTVCATSSVALFCYTPITSMQKLKFENEYVYECIIVPVCMVLFFTASVVHPVFYLFTHGKLLTWLK